MNINNYLKAILEALNLSISRRISLAISFIIFLVIKFGLDFIQKKDFFNWVTGFLVILIFIMVATALADIYDKRQADIKSQKELEQKQAKQKLKHDKDLVEIRLEQARYRKYILNLSGKKLEMVKQLYNNEHGRDFLPDLDVNTNDLILHDVIMSTREYTHFLHPGGKLDEQRETCHLYVLTPVAKAVMDKNKKKFKSA